MAVIRSIPRTRRLPSFTGRVMVDTFRGVVRVRKWPAKYGKARSALQQFWIDWFRQANLLAKYADANSQIRAKELTAKSGIYPRDILLAAMRGRLYHWADKTGWKWYSMAAIGDISESLDVLAQTVGSVLCRATDRWRAVVPGSVGDRLTYQGDTAPPTWETPSAPGTVTQEELTGTPLNPDNTVAIYDFDVTKYATVTFMFQNIGLASASQPQFRFSTDGGVSYKSAANDYRTMQISSIAMTNSNQSSIKVSPALVTTGHYADITFLNLAAGRCAYRMTAAASSSDLIMRSGYANFDGPITHIRLLNSAAANFNAGTLRAVGTLRT